VGSSFSKLEPLLSQRRDLLRLASLDDQLVAAFDVLAKVRVDCEEAPADQKLALEKRKAVADVAVKEVNVKIA